MRSVRAENAIWIFVGDGGRFPSGAFSTRERAEAWIQQHRLTGMLTAYPIDRGAYDWAVEVGAFKANTEAKRTAKFIGQFSSVSLDHHHYEDGICQA
jgi:hypothetical protein